MGHNDKFIIENADKLRNSLMMSSWYNNVELLEFLYNKGFVFNTTLLYIVAAEYNCLEVLKYLNTTECPKNNAIVESAIRYGNLRSLKFLIENNFPHTHKIANMAGEFGHLNCLRYLHQRGYICGKNIARYACMRDRVGILRYAAENVCPIDKEICINIAIERNSNRCLDYLRKLK
jgi:hypothetical protein